MYTTIIDGKEWEIRSSTNPQKRYTIKLNDSEVKNSERRNNLSCNCPGWIYNTTGRRTCKHTEEILRNELLVSDKLNVMAKRKQYYGEC